MPICQAHDIHGKSNSQFKLKDVVKLVKEIIPEVKANLPLLDIIGLTNWGALLSFWAYPAVDTHTILGYYHMQTGLWDNINVVEAQKHFADAANHHLK
jgi:hypothetical protein